LRVAVHEAGHALLVLHFYNTFEFQKVSIQPTYNGAGGYTLFTERTEIKEGGLYTKDILKKRLVVIMGGKAAETIFYGKEHISVGAFQDLKEANQLARRMIGQYGMGNHDMEMFFNENIGDDTSPFSIVNKRELYAETTKTKIDEETMKILHESYNVAKKILENNKDVLYKFTDLLLNNTYLYKKDIDTYLGNTS
jgi:cell division protease FtsH